MFIRLARTAGGLCGEGFSGMAPSVLPSGASTLDALLDSPCCAGRRLPVLGTIDESNQALGIDQSTTSKTFKEEAPF
jgi:hypothetical protein